MATIHSLDKLTQIISRFPGVGERTAMRLALYLFDSDDDYLQEFASLLSSLHQSIKLCKKCFALSETDICPVCSDAKRDLKKICVVESYPDMIAINRTDEYNGVFHVLGGIIEPLKGIGISDIKVKELFERVYKEEIKEIMIAFSASLEADTTANYIYRTLKDRKFEGKITRITYGISLASDIENADLRSLARSIIDRVDMN